MTDATSTKSPYEILGEARIRAISARFYDLMDRDEPALAKLHKLDEAGRVHPEARDKFTMFFIGWLGGPQDYVALHGRPRLRMRHANVKVDVAVRGAWLRAMVKALDEEGVDGPIRAFLETRLSDLADHMRNVAG